MRRGFTLVEIMVSLAILTLILMTISGLYASSVRMRNTASELTVRARLGNALLGAVRRDLDHLAVYPGRRAAFFVIETDRDGSSNRRDRLSFDALIPFTTEEGNVVLRFGRISYTAEGQLDDKKLTRTTVFINDEYNEDEKEDKKKDDASEESMTPETPEKEAEAAEAAEDLAEVKLKRGEEMTVLARNVIAFSVDIPKEESGEWDEQDLKGRVPAAVRVTLILEVAEEDESGMPVQQEFQSIFMPVMAGYVGNQFRPGAKEDRKYDDDDESEEAQEAHDRRLKRERDRRKWKL